MQISPFKHKHSAAPHYKRAKFVDLRCLKDNSLRRFVDDGPWSTDDRGNPVNRWQEKTPQSGRANLVRKIRQRDADPLGGPRGDDPEAKVPIFVFDGDGPVPRVWDSRLQEYIEPAVMNDHHRRVMAFFVQKRDTIELEAKAQIDKRRREAEDKAAAGADAVLAKLGELVARAPAPRAPKGGAA